MSTIWVLMSWSYHKYRGFSSDVVEKLLADNIILQNVWFWLQLFCFWDKAIKIPLFVPFVAVAVFPWTKTLLCSLLSDLLNFLLHHLMILTSAMSKRTWRFLKIVVNCQLYSSLDTTLLCFFEILLFVLRVCEALSPPTSFINQRCFSLRCIVQLTQSIWKCRPRDCTRKLQEFWY